MADGAAVSSTVSARTAELEGFRPELTGYCYRMLGSSVDAEDAVQDVMLRAWRGLDDFEDRSSLRTWLYRIAHNRCIDLLRAAPRRERPIDLGPSSPASTAPTAVRAAEAWLQPVPDVRVFGIDADPADVAASRDTLRLAFVAALQHLPPRQRAVLVLREALEWPATDVAALLDTSVSAVNSALQRARATLSDHQPTVTDPVDPADADQQALLNRYMKAFENYDLNALTSVLHEDAVQSMPPYELWLRGAEEICTWMVGHGHGCRGSRLVPTAANAAPAFGQYRPAADGDGHEPWALQVLDVANGRIVAITSFLDTATLFPVFGLPDHLDPHIEQPDSLAKRLFPVFGLPDHLDPT